MVQNGPHENKMELFHLVAYIIEAECRIYASVN